MGSYTLSTAADLDIETIAEASVQQWGMARAEKYLLTLHKTLQMSSEFPDLGRNADDVRAGYRRIEPQVIQFSTARPLTAS